ncbi:MAG: patatin-like phospholipase family protein [Myxococcales bacterium]|nr:patatin-like phospholipase family protein [Myxococcales bacterium]
MTALPVFRRTLAESWRSLIGWGLGVVAALADLLPPVTRWAGASAGAFMCLAHVSGRRELAYAAILEAAVRDRGVFEPRRLLRGERPFPHGEQVRGFLEIVLAGDGFARVRSGSPVHILMSCVDGARGVWPRVAVALASMHRRGVTGRVHGPARPVAGLRARVVCSHDAADPGELRDWVLMSGAVPPVMPVLRQTGTRYFDGALIDNAPVRALPDAARGGRVLVILSSPYPVPARPRPLPGGGQALYLAPRGPLPITNLDCAAPEKVIAARALGERDGRSFRGRVAAFLASSTDP